MLLPTLTVTAGRVFFLYFGRVLFLYQEKRIKGQQPINSSPAPSNRHNVPQANDNEAVNLLKKRRLKHLVEHGMASNDPSNSKWTSNGNKQTLERQSSRQHNVHVFLIIIYPINFSPFLI
jgi:hypothetical protein